MWISQIMGRARRTEPMPRFHFHLEDGATHSDEQGVELADVEAARAYAQHYLADALNGSECSVWRSDGVRMEVADEAGLTLFGLYLVAVESPAALGRRDPGLIAAVPTDADGGATPAVEVGGDEAGQA
jgi:hypothetical protein